MFQLKSPGEPELRESVDKDHEGLAVIALLNVVHLQTGQVDIP